MKWFKAWFHQEKEKLKVNSNELEQWFNEQTQENVNKFKKEIKNILSNIEIKINNVKENIKLLEQARIKDNIEKRIKLIISGNKEAYINQIQLFLEQIIIPEEISHDSSLKYCSNFEDNLKNLSGKIVKNQHIIEQLLGEEINKVTLSIKEIYNLVKDLKLRLEKKEIVSIKNCQEKIRNLKKKIKIKDNAEDKIKENKVKIAEKEIIKEDILRKISSLKNSKEYENLRRLREKKEEKEKEIIGIENQINQLFKTIERVFKKFQNINKVQFLDNYIISPSKAVSQDKDLKILEYLKEIEGLIHKGKIEIKDKKKKKTLEILKNINKTKLEELSNKYSYLKSESKEIKSKIISDNLSEKFEFLNNKLTITEKEIQELNEKIKTVEEINEKIEIEEEEKQLENLIQSILNQEIEIIQDGNQKENLA